MTGKGGEGGSTISVCINKSDFLFLPTAVSLFKDSTARMPARARRAAAGSRGSQQAEGERENGVQESKGSLGQTKQRARE